MRWGFIRLIDINALENALANLSQLLLRRLQLTVLLDVLTLKVAVKHVDQIIHFLLPHVSLLLELGWRSAIASVPPVR